MPNQRDPTKRALGSYFDAELVNRFRDVCHEQGVAMSEALSDFMREKVAAHESRKRRSAARPSDALKAQQAVLAMKVTAGEAKGQRARR